MLVTRFSNPKIGAIWFDMGFLFFFPGENGNLGNVVW